MGKKTIIYLMLVLLTVQITEHVPFHCHYFHPQQNETTSGHSSDKTALVHFISDNFSVLETNCFNVDQGFFQLFSSELSLKAVYHIIIGIWRPPK
jgi:hypothetical protein